MHSEDRRENFLQTMYGEMWNNINRHLTVTWQAVGVLAGAFALFFGLAERQAVPVDAAAALMILIAGWQLSHVYDANTWFNRNLGIISNIERQFLTKRDIKEVEFYFSEPHRKPGNLVAHLRVQRDFGFGVMLLVLVMHFLSRVAPGFGQPWDHLEPMRTLPYIAVIAVGALVFRGRADHRRALLEFNQKSPGASVKDA